MDDTIDHATNERLVALEERVTKLEEAGGVTKPAPDDDTEVDNTLPGTDDPTAEPKYEGI